MVHFPDMTMMINAGVVYWLDIVMGFSTGFVVIYNLRRKVIRDPRMIAEYYMRYSTFVVDLLAALPVIAEVRLPDCAEHRTHKIVQLLRGKLVSEITGKWPTSRDLNLTV